MGKRQKDPKLILISMVLIITQVSDNKQTTYGSTTNCHIKHW